MGDSSETYLESQSRRTTEEGARERRLLDKLLVQYQCLHLDYHSISMILNHIDYFVSQSRGNKIVKQVSFYPYSMHDDDDDVYDHDDDVWDKFGQAIGNLQALGRLHIATPDYHDEDEELPIPDWYILACILSHVRQKITLSVNPHQVHVPVWCAEDYRSFAQAIRGHPTITSFEDGDNYLYEALDTLYSALATLPALESITINNRTLHARSEDDSTLVNPDSLTELLRVPSLRYVLFHRFSFTPALCQATANAFMEGTAVTKVEFTRCSFSGGCATILANGLSRNTSVIYIRADCFIQEKALFYALAAALPSNSTLRDISFVSGLISVLDLSPVLLALGKNMGLKDVSVDGIGSIDESFSAAMKDGLGTNTTLEHLKLKLLHLTDDNPDLWSSALSFLRTNKTLKSLVVDVQHGVTESCLSAFRIDIVAMLQENVSLESISIANVNVFKIKAEEWFVIVTALQHNTTLKTISFQSFRTDLTDDEDKQMASLLKKNYALERLPNISQYGDVGAILRLNEAGRRYLIQDGSSVSKGVEVLSRVNDDINCVFLHLLENPTLCDRSAVEMVSTGDPTASSGGGKREQANVDKSKESRRRLA
jgi:hypothetical protein